ncbi:hypothetical protein FSP39_013953 [Pinctada imbricata]|uniref:Uncharacterized protein n=1 Tax=Pinctada imbricata TaxID=66713 RepID=A0AA88XUP9_PINIB|nr:hypothetical protein FSP39_013953 [Pinctada imbricata]
MQTEANHRTFHCSHSITGRFVVIYNERNQTNPPSYRYSTEAILELCEVEVPIEGKEIFSSLQLPLV